MLDTLECYRAIAFPFPGKNPPSLAPSVCPKRKEKREKKNRNSKSTMTTIGDGVEPSDAEALVPAFAKLQGEDFEYYMRKYSIMLGRNSSKTSVDLDLRSLGGGLAISRQHARIYYDFNFRCFALEVIGRKGCIIRNVLFMPDGPPIKLNSQDLLQIGEVRFYFLLPTRSFFETSEAAWQIVPPLSSPPVVAPPTSSNDEKKGEERDGDREGSLGIGHGEDGVSCLIVQEFNAKEAGGSSSEQSGAFEASRQIVPPLPPQLVVVSLPSSNNEMKGEKKEGDREESQGTGHGTDDVTGSIVEKFNIKEAGGSSSDMLSGGMEQFSLSNEKLEPRSSSVGEADNKDETPDIHVLKANLPVIKKEQIKLEVGDGKLWIQISSEHTIANEEKTDMWHFVEDRSGKFLRRYFMLPESVKIDQIKAVLENDVLTVTVPKGKVKEPGQPGVKSIEIFD